VCDGHCGPDDLRPAQAERFVELATQRGVLTPDPPERVPFGPALCHLKGCNKPATHAVISPRDGRQTPVCEAHYDDALAKWRRRGGGDADS
jgi:hypothetical protein